MAREKTVFNSEMVAHLWANGHKTETRNPAKNVFTRVRDKSPDYAGSNAFNAIYSYGEHFPMGAFINSPIKGGTLLLINESKTTSTTNKHRSYVYRALSRAQSENRVIVPEMRGTHFETINGLLILAEKCVNAAREPLEKSKTARENRPGYINAGNRFFDSARKIYIYCGEKKLAENVPTVSPEMSRDQISGILAGLYREEYTKWAVSKTNAVTGFVNNGGLSYHELNYGSGFGRYSAVFICKHLREMLKTASEAEMYFQKAGAKTPAKLKTAKKTITRILEKFDPLAQKETDKQWADDVTARLRDCLSEMARYSRNNEKGKRVYSDYIFSRLYEMVGRNGSASWADDILNRCFGKKTDSIKSDIVCVISRWKRINAFDAFRYCLKRTADNVRDFENRIKLGHTPENGKDLKTRLSMLETCPEFYKQPAIELIENAERQCAEYAERVCIENAEKIEKWRTGARVQIPRDCPTMARIVGDTVETSRGATVPLDHAKRLAVLARRVARNGGQTWPDGSGPMVGHFRVSHIGADLSAVIGCHEFSPDESIRILSAIESTNG